jgi:nucleotide-binding universal stress UspA family protein
MNRIQKVLVGTDFSAAARHAADRAAMIGKETNAALVLFHAGNLSGLDRLRRLVPGIPNGLEQRAMDERRAEIALLGQNLEDLYGLPADVRVGVGPAFPQIEKSALALSADLIVVGAHGSSTMTHPVLGSTATRLAERSALPVLVVKRTPHAKYRNVLVPVDFSAHSLPALTMACAVAPGANIILMHAYGVPFEGKIRAARDIEETLAPFLAAARKKVFENLHELSDAAGLAPHTARLLPCHGTALHQILEEEKTRHCDLIVIGRHGEADLLERLFLGSVTKQVLTMSRADILVSGADQAQPSTEGQKPDG